MKKLLITSVLLGVLLGGLLGLAHREAYEKDKTNPWEPTKEEYRVIHYWGGQ